MLEISPSSRSWRKSDRLDRYALPVGFRSQNAAFARTLVFVLALTAACVGARAQVRRALPLKRFELTRLAHTPGDAYYQMPAGVSDDYFDGTSGRSRVQRHMKIAREVGAKYLRCAFSWNAIEKAPGKYGWAFWDMLVDEAQKTGIELIPYVAYTPKWAASSKDEYWTQPPRDPKQYAEFMVTLASRYRGRIKAWEIWNEPDNRDYWRGTVAGYAELVREAAVAVRGANPSVVLVLGGMSRGPGQFFRSLLSDYGIGGYVDVIAMHAYPETWDPERLEYIFQDWVQQMSDLMRTNAPGVDFWINEMGYADYRFRPNQAAKSGVEVYYDYEHTREYQARVLFKAEVLAEASPRVSLTVWYRIDDFAPATVLFCGDEINCHLGLVDVGGKPKPAFYALKFFNELFREPAVTVHLKTKTLTTEGMDEHGGTQSVVDGFRIGTGKTILVAWLRGSRPEEVTNRTGLLHDSRKESLAVEMPCRGKPEFTAYDVEGHAANPPGIKDGWIEPILLTGNDVFVGVIRCK